MKDNLKDYFNDLNEKKEEFKIIDKNILMNVVRNFISIFLCENRADSSINEKNSLLIIYLLKKNYGLNI